MWASDQVKENISVSTKDGLSVTNGTATANWMIQYMIGDNVPLSKGTDYSIKITMKGSKSGHATVAMGDWKKFGTPVTFDFTGEDAIYTLPYTSVYSGENGIILMQSGDFDGIISVKSIEVFHSNETTPRYTFELANVNYTAGAPDAIGWGNGFNSKIEGGACVISHGATTNPWDVQVNFENVYPKGAIINLSMEVKGSAENGSISAGLQNPNGCVGCGDFPAIDLTKNYQKVEVSTVCSGDGAKRLLLNLGAYPGTVSIKNLKIQAEVVKQESLTIPSSSFATYAAYYPVNYAELGLEAYAVNLDADKKTITLKKIEGAVSAGVPVLLKGDANAVKALDMVDGGSSVSTDLKVSDGTSTSTAAATLYALSTVGGVTAFYPVIKGSKITAKRCYLEVKSTSSSNAAFYSLGTNFGETTGISSVENKVEKADAPVYNLAGQLVGKDYKGLVIKNGKKFVIK